MEVEEGLENVSEGCGHVACTFRGCRLHEGGIERNVVASLEDVGPNQSYPSSIANYQWTF